MNSEVAWLPVSSGTQVQTQKILNPDYLPEYLSVFYDYGWNIGQIVSRPEAIESSGFEEQHQKKLIRRLTLYL